MVYRDWNRWNDEGFTFLGSAVSISWVYLLSQMLFWQLMYLHCLDIHCCRCSFLDQCICNLLFFEPADAFSLPGMYNCIYILPFLDLRILPLQILHLHPTFSITWGCFSLKFCILNLLFFYALRILSSKITHHIPENPLSQISSPISFAFYLLHNLSRYITCKKIDIRNSSEYGMGVEDT